MAITAALNDEKAPTEIRVAAVEALGRLKSPRARETLDQLIASAIEARSSNALAEAAVRALPRLGDARGRLNDLLKQEDAPLGLRREALRTLAAQGGGGQQVLDLTEKGGLPEVLKTEATIALNASPDRSVRDRASRVLPLPKTAAGKPLPPIEEILRRDGNASKGRTVFFSAGRKDVTGATQSCGACHRVQGQGQWYGPDLSTIGVKYGKDELLRSILNPSAAIGHGYAAVIVITSDGRVINGLPVEDTPDRLVLKTVTSTAVGERITLKPAEIEERKTSEVSLMPEGLAETMGEQDLVDLLAFLATLRQPVSIVGQVEAAGPLKVPADGIDSDFVPGKPVTDAAGKAHEWRRVSATAEGLIDLGPLSDGDAAKTAFLYAPVVSPDSQPARLVFDTKAEVRAWLDGKPLEVPAGQDNSPRALDVKLPKGTAHLLIQAPVNASLVVTFVCDRPVAFSPTEAKSDPR